MSITQNEIKEYDYLRDEINQKIELHNKLLTFTITTVVAVLSFALSKDNPLLYLLPLSIILPMSSRIAYYRTAMAKLSAYVVVFFESHIEGLNWESRNAVLVDTGMKDSSKVMMILKNFSILHHYECLVLSILCYILYLVNYLNGKSFQFITVINILWPITFLLVECIITYQIRTTDTQKKEWVKRWQTIKNSEKE